MTTKLAIIQERTSILAKGGDRIDVEAEKRYLQSIFDANPRLLGVAQQDLFGLDTALLQLATAGLTLNPALKQVYLLTRSQKIGETFKNRIVLSIGYLGLQAMLMRTGLICMVEHGAVHTGDKFALSTNAVPLHQYDPFSTDRGEFRGVYAYAVLANGGVVNATMGIDRLDQIRAMSDGYKSYLKNGKSGSCVWVDHEQEMRFKSVLRVLCKHLLPLLNESLGKPEKEILSIDHDELEADHNTPQKTQETSPQATQASRPQPSEDEKKSSLMATWKNYAMDGEEILKGKMIAHAQRGNLMDALLEASRIHKVEGNPLWDKVANCQTIGALNTLVTQLSTKPTDKITPHWWIAKAKELGKARLMIEVTTRSKNPESMQALREALTLDTLEKTEVKGNHYWDDLRVNATNGDDVWNRFLQEISC